VGTSPARMEANSSSAPSRTANVVVMPIAAGDPANEGSLPFAPIGDDRAASRASEWCSGEDGDWFGTNPLSAGQG
jgi:hypothetical protein